MSPVDSLLSSQKPLSDSPLWLKRLLFFLALSPLLVWAILNVPWWTALEGLPWWKIREVSIEVDWPLGADVVRRWLPPLEGKSLVGLRAAPIVTLLGEKGWVDSVLVRKDYPERLLIRIGTKRASAIRVARGESVFLDSNGGVIEKATPDLLRAFDLPIVTYRREANSAEWPPKEVVSVVTRLAGSELLSQVRVSEISLGSRPFFSVFLSRPKIEIEMSLENWETQLPLLALLLHSPPSQIIQPKKISLLFPKKAVVSSPVSK